MEGAGWALEGEWACCSLSLLSKTSPFISQNRKKLSKKKRIKEVLGIEFAREVNFPGLIKMSLFRENRKEHMCEV